jgi:hypothetical protein
MRHGISLIEVLVAVFVLTLGLMGIAMVIPAGNALMAEAAKNDRGSACGRAALQDVQVRRWYDSSQWVQKWDMTAGAGSVIPARINGGLIYGETFFLDPFFFVYANNESVDSVRHFPYSAYPWREFAVWGPDQRQWPDRALARRIALRMPDGALIPDPLAERLTTWADELIFSLEKDAGRPRQTYIWTDGNGWSAPTLPGDQTTASPADYPLVAASEGRFTWAAMISPITPATVHGTWSPGGSLPPVPLVNPALISQYEVSIVVFYNRNRDCPTSDPDIRTSPDMDRIHERSVYARLDGGGIGGGEVLLFVPNGDPARPPGYLNVKRSDWIMLKGLDRSRYVGPPINPGIMPTCPTVCKWYRVVAIDDEQQGMLIISPPADPFTVVDTSNMLQGRGRYVTLAGPDWQLDTTSDTRDLNELGVYSGGVSQFFPDTDIAEAALVEDVVGVYTTIIDVNSI